MITVGIYVVKNCLSKFVEQAVCGEERLITRGGEQVARLMPLGTSDALGQKHALASRIRRTRVSQAPTDGASIRDSIKERQR